MRIPEADGEVVLLNPAMKSRAALYSAMTQFKNSAFYRKDMSNLAYEVSATTMSVTVH